MSILAIAICGYLLGSIPAGYLVGRWRKIDIRTCGSGNIGATNVVRVLGKKYGYPVFLFDFLKGVAAVQLAFWIAPINSLGLSVFICAILAGICCVLGHSYPIWLRFKGGKGVATSLGVLFALDPLLALSAVVVWLVTFFVVRVVSIASIAAAVALPIVAAVLSFVRRNNETALLPFTLAVAAVVVWRHRTNIARLRRGEELSFNRK
jgi:acyl phosphate:glycerol-3-phosphate acyltransferase